MTVNTTNNTSNTSSVKSDNYGDFNPKAFRMVLSKADKQAVVLTQYSPYLSTLSLEQAFAKGVLQTRTVKLKSPNCLSLPGSTKEVVRVDKTPPRLPLTVLCMNTVLGIPKTASQSRPSSPITVPN